MKKRDYLFIWAFFVGSSVVGKVYLPPALSEQLEEQNSPKPPKTEQPIQEQAEESFAPMAPQVYEEQIPTGTEVPQQEMPEFPQFDPSMGLGMEGDIQYDPSQIDPSIGMPSFPTGPENQMEPQNKGGY